MREAALLALGASTEHLCAAAKPPRGSSGSVKSPRKSSGSVSGSLTGRTSSGSIGGGGLEPGAAVAERVRALLADMMAKDLQGAQVCWGQGFRV